MNNGFNWFDIFIKKKNVYFLCTHLSIITIAVSTAIECQITQIYLEKYNWNNKKLKHSYAQIHNKATYFFGISATYDASTTKVSFAVIIRRYQSESVFSIGKTQIQTMRLAIFSTFAPVVNEMHDDDNNGTNLRCTFCLFSKCDSIVLSVLMWQFKAKFHFHCEWFINMKLSAIDEKHHDGNKLINYRWIFQKIDPHRMDLSK